MPAGEVLHTKINADSNETRGTSLFAPLLSDEVKDAGHEAKADIKETTGVTAGNGGSDKAGKHEKNAGIPQRKKDAANDDIIDMPKE